MSNNDEKKEDIFLFKKLIKDISQYKNNGTSLVSVLIPAGDMLHLHTQKLTQEYAASENIKDRVNRLAVLASITSIQNKLKGYKNTPENGLAIYAGEINNKKIIKCIHPIKPLCLSLYRCGSEFIIEPLLAMTISGDDIGFIVFDGKGCIFACVNDNNKTILYNKSVDLPNKHRRGGQSSVRFARLRVEKINNYITLMSAAATQTFIKNDKVIVKKIIIAGSAGLKTKFLESLDPRLSEKVIKTIDVPYSGEQGLDHAIQASVDVLKDNRIIQESNNISELFTELSKNSGLVIYGEDEILSKLNEGVVKKLIVYEKIDEKKMDTFIEICKDKATELMIVSGSSVQANQMILGFGGMLGLLRYPILNNEENNEYHSDDNDSDDDSDSW